MSIKIYTKKGVQISGIILCTGSANERRRYIVTASVIGRPNVITGSLLFHVIYLIPIFSRAGSYFIAQVSVG